MKLEFKNTSHIVVLKRNIYSYLFINYLVYAMRAEIKVSWNHAVADDLWFMNQDLKGIDWEVCDEAIVSNLVKDFHKFSDDLYVKNYDYLELQSIYENRILVTNFSKLITVRNYDLIKRACINL